MQNLKLLLVTLGVTLIMIAGFAWWMGKSGNNQTQIPQPNAQQLTEVDQSDGWSKGATTSAKFTIVEFSDFQCPGCAAASPKLNEIVAAYSSDVRLIYHYFPLSTIHKYATLSAQWAEAAGRIGKFWEMHDALFASQAQWANATDPQAVWFDLAKRNGLDALAIQTLATSSAVMEKVAADTRLAEKLRLPGTPSLLLNGEPVTMDTLVQKLESSLGKRP
jgi:protein-disulfide isomerase